MRRFFFLAALVVWAALAANVKLYLNDGGFHLVREYQVQADRVRFYSVERSGWEEIPLNLVDLKRTEAEAGKRKAALDAEQKVIQAEETAERAVQDEIARVPVNEGVYWFRDGKPVALPQAESTVRTAKGRSILNRITGAPLMAGQATVELSGAASSTVIANPEQEFYIRLSASERFGIVKLRPKAKDGLRVVADVSIDPAYKEKRETLDDTPVLTRQLDERLYKIWPKVKLPPGEYAVVEYTLGEMNIQVWDFAIR